jgi:hypothetical protein
MKRWALLFVHRDGVPRRPDFAWMDMDQEYMEAMARDLNKIEELSAQGLYYAVEIEDE